MPARLKFVLILTIAFSAIFLLQSNKLCLFLPSDVFAAFSLSISSINPDSVSYSEQEVTVNIDINDLPSESYFRVAWQESSGKPYFGYMKNNTGDWVKIESGQDCKNYYKISDLTMTSLIIVTKIGEENTINNGSYFLKARRYTASCSSYKDTDPVSIQVNLPTPTPTPTEEPEPEPENTPTPTLTPIPTQKSTPTPTQKPTPTKTPTPSPTPPGEILGEEVTPEAEEISSDDSQESTPSSFNLQSFLPFIFVGLGVLLLAVSGGSVLLPNLKKKYRIRKHGKAQENI